jgi:molybdopterin biosynthesis enzyme MoaB
MTLILKESGITRENGVIMESTVMVIMAGEVVAITGSLKVLVVAQVAQAAQAAQVVQVANERYISCFKYFI